jgi:hypothetical protein
MQGVMSGYASAGPDLRRPFFEMALPALSVMCEAFPLLLDSCLGLLAKVRGMGGRGVAGSRAVDSLTSGALNFS